MLTLTGQGLGLGLGTSSFPVGAMEIKARISAHNGFVDYLKRNSSALRAASRIVGFGERCAGLCTARLGLLGAKRSTRGRHHNRSDLVPRHKKIIN